MKPKRAWTSEDTAFLKEWAGRKPDRAIAAFTGHAVITIRKQRTDRGLPSYCHRPTWTRRDWLLNSAAGLDFQISH